MEIVEIRDLDGPNLFMLRPAIKLELDTGGDEIRVHEQRAMRVVLGDPLEGFGASTMIPVDEARLFSLLEELIHVLHDRAGADRPHVLSRPMEEPNHFAVAFAWSHRRLGESIAQTAVDILTAESLDVPARIDDLRAILASDSQDDDAPGMHPDSERTLPVIGITGTNGKTTTTRLVASILMQAGRTVGWTSSSGVYIQQELVLKGDFTGPAGAARVFSDPSVDIAVLETARGGILLRGLGYESNDVSVVTNISPDHLGLHGVHTIEGLAEVKRVVAAVTRASGFAVLNADDHRVLAMREHVSARPFLITRRADHPVVAQHVADAGWALWVHDGQVVWGHDRAETVLTSLGDIPITFGGRARHMLENALCAAAACLAIGLEADQVRAGLAAFRNRSDQNRGRLNVYDVNGTIVIVDFAHNELGLRNLLEFGRSFVGSGGRLISVVGTAGDRGDDVFIALGRIAGTTSDMVIAKDTVRYLRGRAPGESLELIRTGLAKTSASDHVTSSSEMEGFELALGMAKRGDVVAIMCIEDYDTIIPRLESIGTSLS
ncbi:MAG TPA: Mur ligase family protein [Thermomicrobiales bacterium]|nr:Mur ligase family protein [Thermomicrobiales bacterium]